MFIIIMGVSGCGKTTIGRMLAARLGWSFHDGDDFHPPENLKKMSSGIPLTDEDRQGWLQALAEVIHRGEAAGESGIIACSALKEKYRRVLGEGQPAVRFVYLAGSYEFIHERMMNRAGHYMKPFMLQSQFADLEEPVHALKVDITRPPEEIVEDIFRHFFPPAERNQDSPL
jgi:gluconokinase